MSTLSTHILDISTGRPAQGVKIALEREGALVARGVWFAASGRETLYLSAQIDFVIREAAGEHYHLPFLISPGGWSTYRGS